MTSSPLFRVRIPASVMKTGSYAVSCLLEDFLNKPCEIAQGSHDENEVVIYLEKNRSGSEIRFPISGLKVFENLQSPADFDAAKWSPKSWVFENKEFWTYEFKGHETVSAPVIVESNVVRFNVDVLATFFLNLSRVDEYAVAKDVHGRPQEDLFINVRHNLETIPVVDILVLILDSLFSRVFGLPSARKQKTQVIVSSDIDHPYSFYANGGFSRFVSSLKDVLVRYDPFLAFRRWTTDPLNTFDFMMKTASNLNIRMVFNLKVFPRDHVYDHPYRARDSEISRLIKRISMQGGEIGFHPSYQSSESLEFFKEEAQEFFDLTKTLDIKQSRWGGRHHYLRIPDPSSLANWQACGFDYDASLGFSERIGFRAGTSQNFRPFNFGTMSALKIYEEPFSLMDHCGFGNSMFMVGPKRKGVRQLLHRINQVQGCFHVVWHNSALLSYWQKKSFKGLLKIAASDKSLSTLHSRR